MEVIVGVGIGLGFGLGMITYQLRRLVDILAGKEEQGWSDSTTAREYEARSEKQGHLHSDDPY